METLYDKASLVLNPGVYDTGKVYVTKPFDGSGDLTFSRASNATRVNADGLVEKVRQNLALYSQDLSNAAYTGNGDAGYSVIKTANYTTAPDGTQTATRVQITRGSSYAELYQRTTIASGIEFTVSFWGKALSGTPTLSTAYNAGYFNLVTFTSEWVRYTYTAISAGTASAQGFNLLTWSSLPTTSTSADVAIWGVQIETGVATDYIATTSTAVSVGPVSGLPRLDYSGGASCPSLLLEGQRTNLVQFSEQFDNAWWVKGGAGVMSSNSTDSLDPSGYYGADKWLPNAGTAYAGFENTAISATIGTTYTTSFFAKANGYRYAQLLFDGGDVSGNPCANFDLQTGVVTREDSGISASIVSYGNGWYRCIGTYVAATTSFENNVGIQTDPNAGRAQSNTYNGTDSILFWGFQMEEGAYATSYIPTLSSAVTRVADAASKTGISSLIGQTEGTIFVDLTLKNGATGVNRVISLTESNWSSGGSIRIDITSTSITVVFVDASVSYGGVSFNTSFVENGTYKIAVAYKANDIILYMNGTQLGTNTTSIPIPTCSEFYLNELGGGFGGPYEATAFNQALLFTSRLSNADLATLTTI